MTPLQYAVRDIMNILKENVPEPMKEAFMARLGTVLQTAEDDGLTRQQVFNELYKALHAEPVSV